MKKILITDFLNNDNKNDITKKYLELPVFDRNYNLKKKIILFKKWKSTHEKLNNIKKNVELYEYFLSELAILLNNYHNKNYSKKFWSIILGQWLFKFISSVSFKWNLIKSLKRNQYIFIKKKIKYEDIIPLGIEDFVHIFNSNYWNHYIYTKIIEHSFSKKIKIKNRGKILKNLERELIYKKLKHKNFKEKLSYLIQKIFNFIFKDSKTLIFSTYLSNLQEIKLNFLVNKSLLYYKVLRPYHLFKNKNLFKFHREKNLKLKFCKQKLKNFLSTEIINSIPSAYLENFENVEKIVNEIPYPKSPKKIFTTLGINRNTLLDRYIATNIENGSSLILAQHGGVYFQHKNHFASDYELKISDKYFTWGKIKKKHTFPIGVIKNLKDKQKNSNRIILEVRKRSKYEGELKTDSGFFESEKYNKSLSNFFSLIKNNKITQKLYIKLHERKSLWHEKEQFLSLNSELNFLDDKSIMIKEINNAKLIIYTFCGTGHLESLSVNKPTLILFVHDINFLNNKTKNYFKKFIKLGIVHLTSKSLFNMLKKLDNNKKIDEWWNSQKRQNLIKKYTEEFGFYNKKKIEDISRLISKMK